MLVRLVALLALVWGLMAHAVMSELGHRLQVISTVPLIASIVAFIVLAGPSKWVGWLNSRYIAIVNRLRNAKLTFSKQVIVGLLTLGVVVGAWTLHHAWQRSVDLQETDQGAYLTTSQEIARAGGPFQLLAQLYTGEFREANRNPFYLGLLCISPGITWGKATSTVAVLIAICGTMVHLVRRGSALAAALLLIWCAFNPALLETATMLACEGWLLLWISAVWWTIDTPDVDSHGDAAQQALPHWGALFFAGLLLGLAWLTKGSVLPLVLLTIVWLVQLHRSSASNRAGLMCSAGLFLAGWLIAAHPLIVRNYRAFGSPFYNENTALLFVDTYEDPGALSRSQPLTMLASEYLSTHSVGDIIWREASGIVWETFIALRILGVGESNLCRALSGGLMAMLVILGMSCQQRPSTQLAIIWTVTMLAIFSWYIPIAAGDRFPVPFLLIWLSFAAEAAARLAGISMQSVSS